ncbi:MAG TPA: outer membrane lipoprotein-sorting protein [Nevskiaceae bacterium]|nr:outer membrane lipoprotein-sorting protein [Nevskiaceae bacterium]
MKLLPSLALVLVSASAAAAEPSPTDYRAQMTVAEIQSCMRGNLAEKGSLRDISVRATDAGGEAEAFKLKLFWKPNKEGQGRMTLRLIEPSDLAGSSYLLVESAQGESVYFYVPAAQKVQKVEGEQAQRPLWGTDFSYAEIKQVQGLMLEGATQRGKDAAVGGRPAFVLSTVPADAKAQTRKVVSYIDQESCVLVKAEFLGADGKPRKELSADLKTLTQLDEYWFALDYTMRDLAAGSQTQLSMSELYLLEKVPERVFDPASFFQPFE